MAAHRTTVFAWRWRATMAVCAAVLAGIPADARGAGGQEARAPQSFRPPGADEVLRTLKPGHPRLIMEQGALGILRKWIAEDPVAERTHREVIAAAEKALAEKPPVHELRDSRRRLYVSGGF